MRPPLPDNADGKTYLNLGCGEHVHPAYINVDIQEAPHVHFVQPVDQLGHFESNSVDMIYSSHCLEHFGIRETSRVLTEWYRVLKPGGLLTLSVPDFDSMVAIYKRSQCRVSSIIFPLMGGKRILTTSTKPYLPKQV